jgi:hypothetical protein
MSRVDGAPFEMTQLVLHPATYGAPGEADLVGFAPGPAGTSRVLVHQDLVVEVDYAEPDRLCSLLADDAGGSRSLEALIGTEAYWAVREQMMQGVDRPQQITPPGTARRRGRFTAGTAPADDEDVRRFGFALAARAVGDDPFEPALVRAVAYVEGAALLLSTPWDEQVDSDGVEEQLVFAAETLLHDLNGEQLLADVDLRQYEQLREAVASVTQHRRWARSDWAQALQRGFPRRLFDLHERRSTPREPAVREVGLAMSAPAVAHRDSTALTLSYDDLPSFDHTVERVGPGRFVYRFNLRPRGTWLRVLDAHHQALLALVPIVKEGRTWEAHVVVPARMSEHSLVHEVTDSPIVESTSSIDLMIEAVDHGRAAARLSAAGDAAAAARWRLCARVWEQLGDTTRAARALAYATDRETVTRPRYLHDAVDEILG